jgi:hypothetical protein
MVEPRCCLIAGLTRADWERFEVALDTEAPTTPLAEVRSPWCRRGRYPPRRGSEAARGGSRTISLVRRGRLRATR